MVDTYAKDVVQVVTLRDFEVQTAEPRPYLGGRPGDGEWVEDFLWPYQHMPRGQTARWFPDQPGEWRIEMRVESLPPPTPGAWPTFAEPLLVKTAIVLTADVSPWGVPHDGLRARLVFATGCTDIDRVPLAIQIQNQSGRTRKYNVVGTTIAKIPQPFHFEFVVDGQPWVNRPGVPLKFTSDESFQPHDDGQIRTIVVSPAYWRAGLETPGRPLGDYRGPHALRMQLHFEPSLWAGGDELWMGKLRTGELKVTVPKRD